MNVLPKNQEFCVVYGGITTKYFTLGKDTGQGEPVSAYLFMPILKIFPVNG